MASQARASRPNSPMTAPGQQAMTPQSGRWMQVKVLYTFDDESKNNCLARVSQPVQIQSVALDSTTQIGVIDIRTCINAIATASPELVAHLGPDYTVYAYDYSEQETPLVGQGMLSWILASGAAGSQAEVQTPITGRVTRNVLGLFNSHGVQETLEVKLKLVKVPNCLQSEYLANMQKYREAGNVAGPGGDAAAWNLPQSSAGPGRFDPTQPQAGILTFEPKPSRPPPPESYSFAPPMFSDPPNGRPSSRPGTPKNRRANSNRSNPPSRASSTRARPPLKHTATLPAGADSGKMQTPIELDNQGRKRARVEQTDWRGPSTLEASKETLRVAASAAASIRGHGTSISHPSASDIAAAEPPNRPPTPIAQPRARALHRTSTSLAHDAVSQKPRWYQSPYAANADRSEGPGSAVGTPDENGESAVSSPVDIPSSPPVPRNASPTPSSPALPLPRLTHHVDSGFVSGALDEYLDDDEMRPLDEEDLKMASRFNSRQPGLQSDMAYSEDLPRPAKQGHNHTTYQQQDQSEVSTPYAMQQETQTGSMDTRYAPVNASNGADRRADSASVEPTSQQFHASGAGVGTLRRASSHSFKVKQAIQTRLEADLAAGKMPPFCKNCGEINTPTWRKCYVKIECGSADHLQFSENEDGLLAWETIERGKDGEITAYRLIKKNVSKAEAAGWEEVQLCNPCGIWLYKSKCMRPPEKWVKNPPKHPPRKRPGRSKSSLRNGDSQSGSNNGTPPLDADDAMLFSALTDEGYEDNSGEYAITDVSGRSDKSLPKSTGARPRSASTGHRAEKARRSVRVASGSGQAMQSSPPKPPGSEAAPISLDETPKPVRRLLFPSPRKEGEVKSLEFEKLSAADVEARAREAREVSVQMMGQENGEILDKVLRSGKVVTPRSTCKTRDVMKTPTRGSGSKRLLSTPSKQTHDGSSTPSGGHLLRSGKITGTEHMTPFSAQMHQLMSEGNNQSPTRFSDVAFNDMFSDAAGFDNSNMFGFSDFGVGNGGIAIDRDMPMPQSDADFFPVFEDNEGDNGMWNGGPLLEGELDALLREAGEDGLPALEELQGLGACVQGQGLGDDEMQGPM